MVEAGLSASARLFVNRHKPVSGFSLRPCPSGDLRGRLMAICQHDEVSDFQKNILPILLLAVAWLLHATKPKTPRCATSRSVKGTHCAMHRGAGTGERAHGSRRPASPGAGYGGGSVGARHRQDHHHRPARTGNRHPDPQRAVLFTSLTTIGGLAPLLFETSLQAQFLIPMAVTISFGLMFSRFWCCWWSPPSCPSMKAPPIVSVAARSRSRRRQPGTPDKPKPAVPASPLRRGRAAITRPKIHSLLFFQAPL
jgi:hypothetical protein